MLRRLDSLQHRPRIVGVVGVRIETPTIKTITFVDEPLSRAEPGQFAMVWVPGVDEIPMSISSAHRGGLASITVRAVGQATRALCKMGKGDLIGVRGPYGNCFKVGHERSMLAVGGGVGLTPMAALVERIASRGRELMVVVGARTRAELLFLARFKRSVPKARIIATTDDGTYGRKGRASDMVRTLLQERSFEMIYACGPEQMMKRIYELAGEKGIQIQASLERYMKCGIGVCGSCSVGPHLVCRDGPIFSGEALSALEDFGSWRRDSSGRKIAI